jgi:hypothetical protein
MCPMSDVRGVANALWVFHLGIERAKWMPGAAIANGVVENSGRNSLDNIETLVLKV